MASRFLLTGASGDSVFEKASAQVGMPVGSGLKDCPMLYLVRRTR